MLFGITPGPPALLSHTVTRDLDWSAIPESNWVLKLGRLAHNRSVNGAKGGIFVERSVLIDGVEYLTTTCGLVNVAKQEHSQLFNTLVEYLGNAPSRAIVQGLSDAFINTPL